MNQFKLSAECLTPENYREQLRDSTCGGFSTFEGWVRNRNEGREVLELEYQAYEPLALKEGSRIVAEAVLRYGASKAFCIHRVGDLAIGELAVWVGVSAPHRDAAFAACRFIIDEVKHRVPIWKKEHYSDGNSGWVNCEACVEQAANHRAPSSRRA